MFVATGSLILPSAFEAALPNKSKTQEDVLSLSRGTAIVLLTIYILYLIFQLTTHASIVEPAACVNEDDVEENSRASLGVWVSASTVFIVAITTAFCSDYLVDSIDEVVKSSGISKTFFGLIIIPIIGNAGISMN